MIVVITLFCKRRKLFVKLILSGGKIMNSNIYEKFFHQSPTAYSIQKVYRNDEGKPIDYEFVAYNDHYAKMMNLKENILNKRYYDVFPTGWEGEENWMEKVTDAVVHNKAIQLDIHRYSMQKWIRVHTYPIGEEIFGCIYYDVTKEYMQDLEIEGFFNVNIDLLCVADVEGRFIKVNKAFEQVLGYPIEELEGKNFTSLIHIEDVPSTVKTLNKLRNQNAISKYVNRVRRIDGMYRYIEWHSQPNGKYIYASGRDITEAKKFEQTLSEKNKKLKELTRVLEEKNSLLSTLAITDELTGLYNRHFLGQRIKKEMKNADMKNKSISMGILDIDHFKRVNDTYGHPVGDEVLKELSKVVNNEINHTDYLVRFGGEEFILVMPNTNRDEAYQLVEKIRKKIEIHEFPKVGHITVSFGVAEKELYELFYSWYDRMDKALYLAKQSGRNRTVVAKQEKVIVDPKELISREDWKSGHDVIDEQHYELIQEANKMMYMSLSENVSMEEKLRKLDFVMNHIRTHFREEEAIIKQLGYPGYKEHHKIHQQLLQKCEKLNQGVLKGEIQLAELFAFIVEEVIIGHSLETDREYFEYTRC